MKKDIETGYIFNRHHFAWDCNSGKPHGKPRGILRRNLVKGESKFRRKAKKLALVIEIDAVDNKYTSFISACYFE